MIKYYTRACNFCYGSLAKKKIQSGDALPLCGNDHIAFSSLEIFKKRNNIVSAKIINIKKIENLNLPVRKKVKKDLKIIVSKRKNFLKNLNFSKTSIMGILNLTPDSFSDGGKFNSKSKSRKRILKMINDGAKIIDIGGESTRPGSKTINPNREWVRIKEVVKNFKKKYKHTLLSVDTRKSSVIKKSILAGADIINDVSGFTFDKDTLNIISKHNISKVIHHMQGKPNTMQEQPQYNNVLLDIYDFFEKTIKNTNKKKIILDPGIGFGKNLKHNLTLISKISLFHSLGFPILVGTSRKRFIGQISGINDSKERIGGTVASTLYLITQGIQLFRVHDVNEIKQSIIVFEKILLNK
tara:strand:- start:2844 stop:3905 length:1062 start_codon:yes stop_codon:yes gene_type:complete